MAVHGIYSSYLGDYEFDIGKTISWHRWLTDKDYIFDANPGAGARNWVIAWDRTVPEASYSFADQSFFTSPAEWRRESFRRADLAWRFRDEDWVIFVDGHEILNFDLNFTLPEGADLFRGWLDTEADGAQTVLWSRHWAFLNAGPVQYTQLPVDPTLQAEIEVEFPTATPQRKRELSDLAAANIYTVKYTVPQYVEIGWLPRMFQVGHLRSGIDWSILDTPLPSLPSGATGMDHTEVVSYGYARWALSPEDLDPDTLAPVSEGVDVGWETRKLLAPILPASGLQADDWATPDPVGQSGPSLAGPGDLPQLGTPAYGSVFRLNLRDGVYYYRTNPRNATESSGELGPVPWDYLNGRPAVSPARWATQ